MRKARLLVHQFVEGAAYHVMSRVTHRQMLFGEEEKAMLVALMRRYERFSGLRVLTYCIMGNHFHLLVEVPQRPVEADRMTDAELVSRVRRCQGKKAAWVLETELADLLKLGRVERHQALRAKWLGRMWNLSAFVQSVKQRFSVWYNKRTQRRGTLWEERYKSVVAMGPEAIASMAAYIDLNPVRAGLVEDPKDYAWSGYGEAMSAEGSKEAKAARSGIKAALCGRRGGLLAAGEKGYLEWYRCWIYGRGVERGLKADGGPMKRGFKTEEAVKVKEAGGELPAAAELVRRVRYFTDGLVVGTQDLLERVFEERREYFGPKRRSGARKMRDGEWGKLRAMRDLQLQEN